MTNWSRTPFNNIRAAHAAAVRSGLNPGPLKKKGDYEFFRILSGTVLTIVAQREGYERVLETVGTVEGLASKGFSDETEPSEDSKASGWKVTPWRRTEDPALDTFEHLQGYWEEQIANPENLEIIEVRLYRIGSREYEYGLDREGNMWGRVLELP